MLAGFSGHLVSEAYLESLLARASCVEAEERQRSRAHATLSSWRTATVGLGPASSLRAMLEAGAEPLLAALGFELACRVDARPRALTATISGDGDAATLLVTFWGEPLDRLWRDAVTAAIERGTAWCLLFNGTHLRIADTGRLSMRRHAQFEIDAALDEAGSFSALWHLVTRGVAASPRRADGRTTLHDLVDESDRHAAGVCRALKDGVLQASTDVLSALVAGRLRKPVGLEDAFGQALTIVYRLVFLLFAEARALVPMWHPVYRTGYSVDALRSDAFRLGEASGLWDTLRAMTRLAHTGCEAGDLRVTPFNGRLFAPSVTPLADRRNLDEHAARRAVLALSTRLAPDGAGREPIAYRNLGVEQLGSVYETLLDYTPHRETPPDANSRRSTTTVSLRVGSGARKATGTFYTPQLLAEYLVRRTLAPLVHEASPEQILQLRILDPAMGSGAFLVAACQYLAGRYETALVQRGDCRPSDVDDGDRAAIRRTIATRCLYGVDVNPMAVQLARLSLWLVTLANDRPLTFLDHRLQVGDSLVGAWLSSLKRPPTERQRPRRGDEPRLFDDLHVRDALGEALPVRFSLETGPDDTIEAIRAKERAFKSIAGNRSPLARWREVADLWCACWLAPDSRALPFTAFSALADAVVSGRSALPPDVERRYLEASRDIARARKMFHWELEFPEVFFDRTGARLVNAGFDAVIGNPPWDMLRGGQDEHRPRAKQMVRFTRDSGTYDAQSGGGHANLYQLFVERSVSLTRAGGRIGLVVPAGFATDTGNRALRRYVFSRAAVDSVVGFDNHRAIFPIHRSVRFLLVTASRGTLTDSIACRFGVDDPALLESVGEGPAKSASWFPIRVSMSLVDRVSGDDCAIPWLRAPVDVTIAERAASLFPALGSSEGWNARFGRELNASEDKGAFQVAGAARGISVLEGKDIEPFRADGSRSRHSIRPADASRLLPDRPYERARLAYRDVAGVANRLTLIAAIVPAGCVTTHTLFCLKTHLTRADQYFLSGLFNSLVVNYLVRMRVSTHVTTAIVERLPVPTHAHAPAAVGRIAARARILMRRADPRIQAELQADVARLYQLSRDEFAHVLSTFPLIEQRERADALEAFDVS